MTLSISYDKWFREYFKKGKEEQAIKKIVNLAGPLFKHPTLKTKIKLKILEMKYVDADFRINAVSSDDKAD